MRLLSINKNAAAVVGALAMALILIARPTYFSFPLPFRPRRKSKRKSHICKAYGVSDGVVGAVGNTPLIRINSLSEATGCQIYAKAEFMNPGGSVKDRVAATIIQEALQSGELVKGGIVTEGSAGSTAISLATLAPAYGCKCHVVIPDDAAIEKAQILEALGATVERVRPVSITHKDHFVNVARRRAMEAAANARQKESQEINREGKQVLKPCNNGDSKGSYDGINETIKSGRENPMTGSPDYKCKGGGGFFADQFENLANFRAHYQGTGPEIWEQTAGKLHAFVAAAGTGGTLAGISCFLKDKDPDVKCFLVDPPGSGLFNKITRGVMYTCQEAEGKRLKNPFDTITEGIGINRITENFQMARLDGAFRATDIEAVEMSRFLLKNDGLFVGSSSAVNCVGALRVARQLGPGHTVVTILCDSGMRHLTKFYNPHYLAAHNLTPCASGLEFLGKT